MSRVHLQSLSTVIQIFDGQLKETFKIELTIQADIIESFRFIRYYLI